MSKQLCTVCGGSFAVPVRDQRLIHSGIPAVCSIGCVQNWITAEREDGAFNPAEYGAQRIPQRGPVSFRSDLERHFSSWAEWLMLRNRYEGWAFPVGRGFYIPDFWFPDYGCFIELKGMWRTGAKTKMTKFYDQYPDVPLLLVPWTIGKGIYKLCPNLRSV